MGEPFEVVFHDAVAGYSVLRAEPPVIELFTEWHGSVGRVHLAMAQIQVAPPDRQGLRRVEFRPGHHPGGFDANIPPDAWPRVDAFLRALPSLQGGRPPGPS